MDTIAYANPDAYSHVRNIISIVLGLSVSRLLTGLARFVQHPKRMSIYWVHLGWVFMLLLYVIEFWWWEFRLSKLREWTFAIYLFVIFYASLFVLACALLFPDDLAEYRGFEDYFMSRRKWFFGLIAMTFVMDLVDTGLKGMDYFRSLGIEYPLRNLCYAGLSVVAMFTANRRFHAVFVSVALVYQFLWITERYSVLS